jgi:hypothetical protein
MTDIDIQMDGEDLIDHMAMDYVDMDTVGHTYHTALTEIDGGVILIRLFLMTEIQQSNVIKNQRSML